MSASARCTDYLSTATGEKARCADRDAEVALFLAVKSEAGSAGEHVSLLWRTVLTGKQQYRKCFALLSQAKVVYDCLFPSRTCGLVCSYSLSFLF